MKVLVCDDVLGRLSEIANGVAYANQPEPEQLGGTDLSKELKHLISAINDCIRDPMGLRQLPDTRFNGADLVILDNNLAWLEVDGARHTAESVSGFIRAFTSATYIVSLNKNPDVDFDLRYLVGDHSTRADLAINLKHLQNQALWNGDRLRAKDGFLPWYWPRLEEAITRRQKQIEFVDRHLDDSVTSALGFDDESLSFLSLHATSALSPKAELEGASPDGTPIKKLTFRDVFIEGDRSLPVRKEREGLSDAEKKGNALLRNIISRIVAADVDLWFRRDVVGPQTPLVDVPHTLLRLPFLLGTKANDLDAWNRSISENAAPFGIEQTLYDTHLAEAVFKHPYWVPSACFWWPRLKANETLDALMVEAKEGAWADVVFCEDCSSFIERSTPAGPGPREFSAELEGAWATRHVALIDGYHYVPRSRFAI